MGKLVVVTFMTVDGFYEGLNKDVTALPMDDAFGAYNLERMKAADAVLRGARSYKMFKGYWPDQEDKNPEASAVDREFARLYRTIRKMVVSDHASTPEAGHPWAGTVDIVRRTEATEAVLGLKRTVPKDHEIVMWGSRTLWTQLLEQGFVDELHLVVGPAAIGDGTRTFEGVKARLRRLEIRPLLHSNSALLRYGIQNHG